MNQDEEILKKALGLYVNGKNFYNSTNRDNIKKAEDYFKKSLEILGELKSKGISNSSFNQLIQTTEAECIKYLKPNVNIFDLISRNDLAKIKELDNLNFRELNSIGNTILHHAVDVGDTGILKEILKKGGMIDTVNGNGHTLLEYACLKKDPNVITFILSHGANMQKHLFFRKGDRRFYLNKPDIDMAILLKLIIMNSLNKTEYKSFSFLDKYLNIGEYIGLDKFTIKDLLIGLHHMFIGKESYSTFKTILEEELTEYDMNRGPDVVKCIYNKVDIILANLVPFINYPFNIGSIFILKNEIKLLLKNILKKNKKDFKNILMTNLFESYIQTNLFQEDYIGIIVYNILSKIKLVN